MADDLAKELLIGFEEGVLQLYSCYIRTRELFPELRLEAYLDPYIYIYISIYIYIYIEKTHIGLDVLSILAYVCCYPIY